MSGRTKRKDAIRDALRMLAPRIALADSQPVLERAITLGRGDISPGAAVWLALIAHIRHEHTAYDALLADGYDRDAARFFVVDEINAVLSGWGCTRGVSSENSEDVGAVEAPRRHR